MKRTQGLSYISPFYWKIIPDKTGVCQLRAILLVVIAFWYSCLCGVGMEGVSETYINLCVLPEILK